LTRQVSLLRWSLPGRYNVGMRASRAVKRFLAAIAKKGGRIRAKRLTSEQKRAIAQNAAAVRWERERARRAASKDRRTKH
jgi:hypothetical protein